MGQEDNTVCRDEVQRDEVSAPPPPEAITEAMSNIDGIATRSRAEPDCNPSLSMGNKEYIPPRKDVLRQYEIQITFLEVGMVIQVGCKKFPFNTISQGMSELNSYVKDPYASRTHWEKVAREE